MALNVASASEAAPWLVYPLIMQFQMAVLGWDISSNTLRA
jgi:hypothetical protein